jgi:hypothetical protein
MIISLFDAWILRKLLVGYTLNGEVDCVSEALRPLAERLEATAVEGRLAAWSVSVAHRDDKDDLILAVANADPDGPAPAPETGDPEPEAANEGGELPAPGPAPCAPRAPAATYPYLPPGKVVYALDRRNYGKVTRDDGDYAFVYFESENGHNATVRLPKSLLRNRDGSPLTGIKPANEVGEDGWPPIEIDTEELPVVEPFPLDTLPERTRRFVEVGAETVGSPVDFFAVSVLAVAGGTIGRTVAVSLKPNYIVSTALYTACIGLPSDGKSPALRLTAAPIHEIDLRLAAEHAAAMEEWRRQAEEARENEEDPPPRPKPPRINVDDFTTEAVPLILAVNPRGVCSINDELSGLLMGLDQYKHGRGSDQPFLMKCWAGDAVVKDRVGGNGEPIRVPHPFLMIIGGLVPARLDALGDSRKRADGFLARFLLCYPNLVPVPPWNEEGLPEPVARDWADVIEGLWRRTMDDQGGQPVPHLTYLTPEGKRRWRAHYDAHVAEMNAPDFDLALRAPWGKLREYAGRLALLLTCLRQAEDPLFDHAVIPPVDAPDVDAAWQLVTYFKSHTRRVYAALDGGLGFGGDPVVMAVVKWIKAGNLTTFSISDFKQARHGLPEPKIEKALDVLVAKHAIRPLPPQPSGPRGGRPQSPKFEVNPSLLETYNSVNPENPPDAG